MSRFENILVATDFTDIAERAVQQATDLAASLGAHLFLLHVCEPVPPGLSPGGLGVDVAGIDQLERAAHQRLDREAARTPNLSIKTLVEVGDPPTEILQTAKRLNVDLIVTGTHGRRGLQHALLGSVAESVLRRATCPVLVVRASQNEGRP